MQEEQMRILNMIEAGKLTPEDGARLLGALRKKRAQQALTVRGAAGKALRIQVDGPSDEKVNIAVPLALGRFVLNFLPRNAIESLERSGITADELRQLVAGVEGTAPFEVLNVEADDAKVRISVE